MSITGSDSNPPDPAPRPSHGDDIERLVAHVEFLTQRVVEVERSADARVARVTAECNDVVRAMEGRVAEEKQKAADALQVAQEAQAAATRAQAEAHASAQIAAAATASAAAAAAAQQHQATHAHAAPHAAPPIDDSRLRLL